MLKMTNRTKIAVTQFVFALCAVGVFNVAPAASYQAVVVRVTDGDTVVTLDEAKTQHRVRLSGIDAPERKQAFGQVSRQYLATLVFQKRVTVVWSKLDRYRRQIGKIIVDGHDANLAQVEAGFAWHYKLFAKEQPLDDRSAYAEAEERARSQALGLWRDPHPTPPWDYRRAVRQLR